jgi:hypothetical protein
MHIINFLIVLFTAYWLDILIVVAFIGLLAWLIKRGKKDLVKKIVYDLVVKAEATLGSGTGDLKYNMVVAAVYDKLPLIIRLLFTKKEIDKLITEAVDWLKVYLGQGKNLLGYEQETQYKLLLPEAVPSNAELNNIP